MRPMPEQISSAEIEALQQSRAVSCMEAGRTDKWRAMGPEAGMWLRVVSAIWEAGQVGLGHMWTARKCTLCVQNGRDVDTSEVDEKGVAGRASGVRPSHAGGDANCRPRVCRAFIRQLTSIMARLRHEDSMPSAQERVWSCIRQTSCNVCWHGWIRWCSIWSRLYLQACATGGVRDAKHQTTGSFE